MGYSTIYKVPIKKEKMVHVELSVKGANTKSPTFTVERLKYTGVVCFPYLPGQEIGKSEYEGILFDRGVIVTVYRKEKS